ncbi:hypothetical protein [Allorhodopirellula solitaria]|uniref:Carbamoyl-phosphate synthetase large chain, oligomerization domain n=1 Tax=Allorhodopirellula solitaria TaxID=2527987 RepID=A0A5C5X008_9BACT|nr:hypothetical protein [Allorhodopirellula solitaria]TWT56327.1 Carbamoyl-phosphate synthetase large chain, oligomerization domain [Allorhodopirellula solitaria]
MSEPTTHQQTRWTQAIDRALENMTDVEASVQFHIRRAAIRRRRHELGILRPTSEEPAWTAKHESLLGTMPDREIAAQTGIKSYWVRKRRIDLQIPPYQVPEAIDATQQHRPPHRWTASEEALLGTEPDTVIAHQLDLTPSIVTNHRNALEIEPYRRGGEVEWTPGMLRMLGDVPDGTLAREYGVAHSAVKLRRIEEGIPPFGRATMDPDPELPLDVIELVGKETDQRLSKTYGVARYKIRIYRALHGIDQAPPMDRFAHHWTEQDDQLLGTASDRRVAAKIGVRPQQVMYRRVQLGIPSPGKKSSLRWTKKRIDQLGRDPDHVLGKQWNVSPSVVRKKREELEIEPCKRRSQELSVEARELLGTVPDNVLAKQFGFSPTFIRNARNDAGIAPCRSTAPFIWKKKNLKRLGRVHDDVLAQELSLSPEFIAQKRRALGIAAFRRVNKVDWNDPKIRKQLGVISDAELARKLGVTSGAILSKRKALGIPAWKPPKK